MTKKFRILLFLSFILVTGCFEDKAEVMIKNCADSRFSTELTKEYRFEFQTIDFAKSDYFGKTNIFRQTIYILKEAGFSFEEIRDWVTELKTAEINDTNNEVIDFIKKKASNYNFTIDKVLKKKKLTENLQDEFYENLFRNCELERKGASKTFDAKWKKPIIERPVFR